MSTCCEMKGFLSFIVLWLIKHRQMSGDEIRDEFEKRKGTRPSAGTIYPVLKTLKQNGFIKEIKNGSKEKKYEITKKGKKELETAIKKFCGIFYDMQGEFDRCGCKH